MTCINYNAPEKGVRRCFAIQSVRTAFHYRIPADGEKQDENIVSEMEIKNTDWQKRMTER